MAARACARVQRGKINTATTKVSVPSAAGEQAREDRNGVGGPDELGSVLKELGASVLVTYDCVTKDLSLRYLKHQLYLAVSMVRIPGSTELPASGLGSPREVSWSCWPG